MSHSPKGLCDMELGMKLLFPQLVKEFTEFYGARGFITVFKKLATRPYPEPDKSSPRPPCFWKIHLNIRNILPFTLRFHEDT